MGGRRKDQKVSTPISRSQRGRRAGTGTKSRQLDQLFAPRRSSRQANVLKDDSIAINAVKVPDDKNVIILENTEGRVVEKSPHHVKTVIGGLPTTSKKTLTGRVVKTKPVPAPKVGQEVTLSMEEQNDLLKTFDLDPRYGPSRGIARRARFDRAIRFKLDPVPSQLIWKVLELHEDDVTVQSCIWDQHQFLKSNWSRA